MATISNPEQILPTLRALISDELISKHGYSKRRVAEVMGLTPAAITQYGKRRRGRLHEASLARKEIKLLTSDLASRIAGQHQVRPGTTPNQILEAAYQILAILKGSASKEDERKEVSSTRDDSAIDLLRERLEIELREAQRSLEVANALRDDFTKMLFREIATDSMRHADIVSHLIGGLDSISTFRVEPVIKSYLAQMLVEEKQAAEQPLSRMIKVKHPAVKMLLKSVDADEEKHRKMLISLSSLLEVGERKSR